MTYQVITVEDFEQARLAFAEAWAQTDEAQAATHDWVLGARSTAGLTAALATLGIKVENRA